MNLLPRLNPLNSLNRLTRRTPLNLTPSLPSVQPLPTIRAAYASRRLGALVLTCAAALGMVACAPVKTAGAPEYPVGRARLALPDGAWESLGESTQDLPVVRAGPPTVIPLQTRAVGLRGANKELLAVALVQTNSTNYPREQTLWTGACPQQEGVWVEDVAQGNPTRVDCLRFKRWANNRDWLEKNQPTLVRWMADNKLSFQQPMSHLNYRYTTDGGAYVEVNILADQRLVRPKTHNNEEFLRAGYPAQEWAQKVAQAARQSASMLDGYLALPAFPIPESKW